MYGVTVNEYGAVQEGCSGSDAGNCEEHVALHYGCHTALVWFHVSECGLCQRDTSCTGWTSGLGGKALSTFSSNHVRISSTRHSDLSSEEADDSYAAAVDATAGQLLDHLHDCHTRTLGQQQRSTAQA